MQPRPFSGDSQSSRESRRRKHSSQMRGASERFTSGAPDFWFSGLSGCGPFFLCGFLSGLTHSYRRRMPRFIKSDCLAVGQPEFSEKSPSLLGNGFCELHALRFQSLDFSPDVRTHQIKLLPGPVFGGMDCEFSGRHRKDEPSMARIDRREPQHILKERPYGLGLFAVKNCVCACNHDLLLVPKLPRKISHAAAAFPANLCVFLRLCGGFPAGSAIIPFSRKYLWNRLCLRLISPAVRDGFMLIARP